MIISIVLILIVMANVFNLVNYFTDEIDSYVDDYPSSSYSGGYSVD